MPGWPSAVLFLPITILQCFRMWPMPANTSCFSQMIANFLWFSLLLPSCVIFISSISGTINSIFNGTEKHHLIAVFGAIPHIMMSLRAIMTMAKMHFHRTELIATAHYMTVSCIPTPCMPKVIKKWTKISVGLCLVSFLLIGTYYTLNWLHGLIVLKKDLMDPFIVDLLPITVTTWLFITLQTIFIALPYFLSHLVFVVMIVLGTIVVDCSRFVHRNLHRLHQNLEELQKTEKIGKVVDGKMARRLGNDLEELMRQRASLFQFVETWNRDFGALLLFFYVVDFGISAGNLVGLVTDLEPSGLKFPAKGFGTIVFTFFATIYYIPFAIAAGKAHETRDLVYAISVTLYPTFDEYHELRQILDDFRSTTVAFPVTFSAAEFFHVSKNGIATSAGKDDWIPCLFGYVAAIAVARSMHQFRSLNFDFGRSSRGGARTGSNIQDCQETAAERILWEIGQSQRQHLQLRLQDYFVGLALAVTLKAIGSYEDSGTPH